MTRRDTKQKILDAAELLFAEQGFSDTSLRVITTAAGVNLAAVNYHFGSRKDLIKAVMDRYLGLFMPQLDEALVRLLAQPQISVKQVFDCFVAPLMALTRVRPRGPAIFLQLLGGGYMDNQGFLRWFIINHYGEVVARFSSVFGGRHRHCLPPSCSGGCISPWVPWCSPWPPARRSGTLPEMILMKISTWKAWYARSFPTWPAAWKPAPIDTTWRLRRS